MNERQKHLLHLVIEEVIETGEPVGSQYLVNEFDLDVSPATVRNWFTDLEEEGYLVQPHTSAGRVPTEKGYRLYVDELMVEPTLGRRELEALRRVAKASNDLSRALRDLARLTSDMTEDAVVVGHEDDDAYYTGLSHLLAQPEFQERERLLSLGSALDRLDTIMLSLRGQRVDAPQALIGKECPFGEDCGAFVTRLPDGTLFGIFGSMHMDYRRALAFLRRARDLTDLT